MSPARSIRTILLIASLIAVALVPAAPVGVDTITRTDGDGSKGRLDITSIRLTNASAGTDEIRIVTHDASASTDIRPPDGTFAVSIT